MSGRKQRDRYGRFKGKGGIKPYKSNLQGRKAKRSRGNKAAITLAVVGTAAALAAAHHNSKKNRSGVQRTRDPRVAEALRRVTPINARNLGGRSMSGARVTGTGRPSSANRVFTTNRYGTTRVSRRR